MPGENKFVIIREDLVQDPLTVISDGLLIGRLVECELLLNHPAVSRVQAGIKVADGNYYLFALRPSNPVKLNGKAVEHNEALAAGDILEVGPFVLEIDEADEALVIKVSLQIGRVVAPADSSSPDLGTAKLVPMESPAEGKKAAAKARAAPLADDKALDIFWDKRIREAGKIVKPSPLFPKSQRRAGKTQFNWRPTSDLASRWPVSFFSWGAIVIGLLSIVAAYWYASAYSPAPVSYVHAKTRLDLFPPIAARANGNSCTGCHSLAGNMDKNCASCHTAEAFVPTVIQPHAAAGIGCVSCHAEHRGVNFKAAEAALTGCSDCHNDANKNTYNGHKVATPHGGTFGYPAKDGHWIWKGLDAEEWSRKQIAIARLPTDTDEAWRSKQFHSLHVQRVRVVPGINGNAEGQLSCSSCHKTFNPIDRQTPRTTCDKCHSSSTDATTNRIVVARDKPNCVSCHVQHVKDKRQWGAALLAQGPQTKND
ncbi:MAG TPA: FHA domain-containing protein [Pyrinomonadaceae bacterium]|nr:FHA domain-containing protein [Pyrinomonadaceae bacterium]